MFHVCEHSLFWMTNAENLRCSFVWISFLTKMLKVTCKHPNILKRHLSCLNEWQIWIALQRGYLMMHELVTVFVSLKFLSKRCNVEIGVLFLKVSPPGQYISKLQIAIFEMGLWDLIYCLCVLHPVHSLCGRVCTCECVCGEERLSESKCAVWFKFDATT